MITETTYSIKETVEETSPYGTFTTTYTRMFIIQRGPGEYSDRFYQTERTYRNNVITFSGNYPADTEYAKGRRMAAGMEW